MFEIGSSLREARQRQGLEIPELEQTTKIRAKYLRALEDEQFDTLPGPSYVKGFLRAYADGLGLDGRLYVDEYNSRFFIDEESAPRRRARRSSVKPRRHPRIERNVVLFPLIGIAVVTALIIAAWKFGADGSGGGQSIPNLPAKTSRPKQAAPAARPPRKANLVVQAVRGNSLLEVHVGSATGRLLYEGTLERGESQHFVAGRLWLNVGSPENLWLRLNGRPVPVGGTCPRVLLITARQISAAAHCR